MAAGSNWKYLSLGVLVFQNTALVLTMRYSRTMDGPPYLASTAVVLMEVLKFTFCTFMVLYDNGGDWNKTTKDLRMEILENGAEMLKISVPSILYTIQNNLLYIALTHLDAATFQVCVYVSLASPSPQLLLSVFRTAGGRSLGEDLMYNYVSLVPRLLTFLIALKKPGYEATIT